MEAMQRDPVTCQTCRLSMERLAARLDLGPAEWHPSDDRLSAVFAEIFHCPRCGRVAIRPGAVAAAASRAVA